MQDIYQSYHFPPNMWLFPQIAVFLAVFPILRISGSFAKYLQSRNHHSTSPSFLWLFPPFSCKLYGSDSLFMLFEQSVYQSWFQQDTRSLKCLLDSSEFIAISSHLNSFGADQFRPNQHCCAELLLLPLTLTYYMSPALQCYSLRKRKGM